MQEDALAVAAVKAGDRQRYAELVSRYERMVYGILWSRLGNPELCEEAAQETFVQGFRFLAALRKPERFASWIGKIARNVGSAMAWKRRRELDQKRRWLLERVEQTQSPSRQGSDEPLSDVLREVLSGLPTNHRECLVLYYIEDKSIRECAQALGTGEEALKVRLHRARNALRTEMEEALEQSLRGLAPRQGLGKRVLAAVPALPLGAGSLGIGAILFALITVLPMLLFFLQLNWANRQVVENYRGRKDYRRVVQRRNFLRQIPGMLVAVIAGRLIGRQYGLETLYLILAVLILPTALKSIMFLRLNRSGFAKAQVLGTSAMFAAFLAVALGKTDFKAFVLAMLIFNIALWLGRKSMPGRSDYNLVLRAAHGELGHVPEHIDRAAKATPEEMRRFTRLLGENFLITDYSMRKNACVLGMPAVILNWFRVIWPGRDLWLASTVTIRGDGTCGVTLSERDWKEIRTLCPPEESSYEIIAKRATTALEEALALFVNGDVDGALRILQPRRNEEIMLRPIHELRSMKVIYAASILAGIIGISALFISFCVQNRQKNPPKGPVMYVKPIESIHDSEHPPKPAR